MLYLVSDAKIFCKKQIDGGTCDATKQLAVINEAIMHLITAADWKLTVRRIRLWLCNNWFTCPREFEKVLTYTLDHNPGFVQSQYWEFMEGGPGRIDNLSDIPCSGLTDMGNFPTYADIGLDKERYLIAFSTEESDTNLNLTVRGHLTYNREAMTNSVPGVSIPINRWTGGIEGTAVDLETLQKSSDTFVRVTGVTKPATKGYITLYAYDPDYVFADDEPILQQLSVYHPDERQPSYRRYIVSNSNCCGELMVALCKLSYVPAVRDTDILLIQNLVAIKFMIQAINKYNNEDIAAGDALKLRALNELVVQSRDYFHNGNDLTVQSSYRNSEVPNLI